MTPIDPQDDLLDEILDEIVCEQPEDISIPDLVAVRCEIFELVRRREEGVKEPGDPDDIHTFERRLNRLLDELCAIARKTA